jgi:cobaltochelatase CobN
MQDPVRVVFVSVTGGGIGAATQAYQRYLDAHPGAMELTCRTGVDLREEEAVREFAREHVAGADYLLVILHGGKTSLQHLNLLLEAARKTFVYLHPSDDEEVELSRLHSTDFGGPLFGGVVRLVKQGGAENWFTLLSALAAQSAGASLPSLDPVRIPTEALYHPETGVVDSLAEYLALRGTDAERLSSSRTPVVGLIFYRGHYIDGNIAHVDEQIRAIEAQGGFPLACLSIRFVDPQLRNLDTRQVFERFFMQDGRPLIQVLLNMHGFSLRQATPHVADAYEFLDVPVLQSIALYTTYESWSSTMQGVTPLDVTISAAQPELDGALITVPVATFEKQGPDPVTGATVNRNEPIPERAEKLIRLAVNWTKLRLADNAHKRVAVIFHNYPPGNDRIGVAVGLDSFDSAVGLLQRLHAEGYWVDHVYEDGRELAEALVSASIQDTQWLHPAAMADRAVASIPGGTYAPWVREMPESVRAKLAEDWGSPPGERYVYDDRVLVGGIQNGNTFIGIQPPRGDAEDGSSIHDPLASPTYHYMLFYRWIRDVFRADAVIHLGKHGSLEWLPGKSMALSCECYPDLAIQDLPNIYPYIINDPNEGTQAKRRSYACVVDHMIPVMTNADTYEDLAEVETRVLEYLQLKSSDPKRASILEDDIWELTQRHDLHTDLEIDQETAKADFDAFVFSLHSYLSEVADTAIADGLHVLGQAPEGEGLAELCTQLVRLRNGDVPSLRHVVATAWGYDYDELVEHRGEADPSGTYPTNAVAIQRIHERCRELVHRMLDGDGDMVTDDVAGSTDVRKVVEYVRGSLVPRIRETHQEVEAIVRALSGRHIRPGASGSPTRGMADILPTGRNFYSVDPFKIPGESAWKAGTRLGNALVDRHKQDAGTPPDTIAMVVWAGNTMQTLGEDVAEALYLMGVRPVWNERNGRVDGLEIIPASDLAFPRVDITFRTSGLFRDTFPNVMELLDEAVLLAADQDEPPEVNHIRANVRREAEKLAAEGRDSEEAMREAAFRVFSDPPGAYGTGVPDAIEAKQWETSEDLGDVFIQWGAYAYAHGVYGAPRQETFRRRMTEVHLVVKNEESREYDMLSCTDFNAYHGGLIAAVKAASGTAPRSYSGDASDPDHVKYRSVQQEAKHIFRSRILNPKWIEGLMRHGYKGAGDLAHAVDTVFHWDATSSIIEDWMYEGLAERYALDAEMQRRLKDVNPYALETIVERLLEATARGMWSPKEETKQQLDDLYMDVEAEIEAALDRSGG